MGVNRRKFVQMLGGGVAIAAQGRVVAETKPQQSLASGRPNFLFMIADDMTFRALDQATRFEVKTPNLDRLAGRGCKFTHCFHQGSWMGAVCVASRTMLNTGLSAFRAKQMTEHVAHFQPVNLDDSIPTWGGTLGAAGYDTYMVGKWHLDPPLLSRSFKDMSVVAPGMLPSTSVTGGGYNRPSPGNTWSPTDKKLHGHWLHADLWERNHNQPNEVRHSTEVYVDHAIDNLKHKITKSDAPFFMYVGFNAPHDPRQAPQEFLDMYPEDSITVPPNFLPEHPFNEGEHRIRDEVLAPFPRTPEAIRLHRREYYAIITHLDHHIGRLLNALDESGLAENTYIIMAGDHGLCVGEHGLMGKQNLYEASARMPLIIAGPGITKGKVVDELVYQHSMFATTCELAKVPVPTSVEFPSFASMLLAEAKPQHDAVFCFYKYFARSVRDKKYKLIVYPQAQKTLLYDIEEDPWEKHDLSADPKMASERNRLMERLRKFQKDLGDELNLEHPTPPPVVDAIYQDA